LPNASFLVFWHKGFLQSYFREARECGFLDTKKLDQLERKGEIPLNATEKAKQKIKDEEVRIATLIANALKSPDDTRAVEALSRIGRQKVKRILDRDARFSGEKTRVQQILEQAERKGETEILSLLKDPNVKEGHLREEHKSTLESVAPDKVFALLSEKYTSDAGKIKLRYMQMLRNLPLSRAFALSENVSPDTLRTLSDADKRVVLDWRAGVQKAQESFLIRNTQSAYGQVMRQGQANVAQVLREHWGTEGISKAEKEMLSIVEKTLGETAAKNALATLNQNQQKTEVQRIQEVFLSMENERQRREKECTQNFRGSLVEAIQLLTGWKEFYTQMYALFPETEFHSSTEGKKVFLETRVAEYEALIQQFEALDGAESKRVYFERLCAMGRFSPEEQSLGKALLTEQESAKSERAKTSFAFAKVLPEYYAWEKMLQNTEVIVHQQDGTFSIAEGKSTLFRSECERISKKLGIDFKSVRNSVLTGDHLDPIAFHDVQSFADRYGLGVSETNEMIRGTFHEDSALSLKRIHSILREKSTPAIEETFVQSNPREPWQIAEMRKIFAKRASLDTGMATDFEAFTGEVPDESTVVAEVSALTDQRSLHERREALKNQFGRLNTAFQTIAFRIGKGHPLLNTVLHFSAWANQEMTNLSQPITQKDIEAQKKEQEKLFQRMKAVDGGTFLPSTLRAMQEGVQIPFGQIASTLDEVNTRMETVANASDQDFGTLLASNFPPPPSPLDLSGLDVSENISAKRQEFLQICGRLKVYQFSPEDVQTLFAFQNRYNQPLFVPQGLRDAEKIRSTSDVGFAYDQARDQILVPFAFYTALLRGDKQFNNQNIIQPLLHEVNHYLVEQTRNTAQPIESLKTVLQNAGKYDGVMQRMRIMYPGKPKILPNGQEVPLNDTELLEELFVMMIAKGQADEGTNDLIHELLGNDDIRQGLEQIETKMHEQFINDTSQGASPRQGAGIMGASTGVNAQGKGNVLDAMNPDRYQEALSQLIKLQVPLRDKLNVLEKSSTASNKDEAVAQMRGIMESDMAQFESAPSESFFKTLKGKYALGNRDFNGIIDGWLAQSSEKGATDDGNPLVNLYYNTTFLSLADMKKMWKIFADFVERRHERNSKKRAGVAGKAIFDSVNRNLSNEYNKEVESAEQEEVNKYKDILKNTDSWQLYAIMGSSNNKDEIKAVLYILADNGRIDWRDKRIWRALERQHCGVTFYDSDAYSYNILTSKLQKACAIYDNDFFRQVDTTNASSFESKVKQYDNEGNLNISRLEGTLRDMLTEKATKGDDARVDPHRYISFVLKLQTAGKGDPTDVLYFAIMGVAYGIIPPEYILRLNSSGLNDYPLWEFFTAGEPTQKQYELWRDEILYQKKKPDGTYSDYKRPNNFVDWVYSKVFTQKNVEERLLANFDGGKWDHDHARVLGAMGNTSGAVNITSLSGSGGQTRFKPTMYNNLTVGALQFVTSIGRNADRIPPDQLRKMLSRQAGYSFMLNGILNNKVYTKDQKYRFSEDEKRAPPREAYGYKNDMSTSWYMDESEKIYLQVFPDGHPVRQLLQQLQAMDSREEANFQQIQPFINDNFGPFFSKRENISRPNTLKEVYQLIPELFDFYLDPSKDGVGAEAEVNMQTFLGVIRQTSEGHFDGITAKDQQEKIQNERFTAELLQNAA
jgi:hypothetical protein